MGSVDTADRFTGRIQTAYRLIIPPQHLEVLIHLEASHREADPDIDFGHEEVSAFKLAGKLRAAKLKIPA